MKSVPKLELREVGIGRSSGTAGGQTSSWVETLVDVATNVALQETRRRPDLQEATVGQV